MSYFINIGQAGGNRVRTMLGHRWTIVHICNVYLREQSCEPGRYWYRNHTQCNKVQFMSLARNYFFLACTACWQITRYIVLNTVVVYRTRFRRWLRCSSCTTQMEWKRSSRSIPRWRHRCISRSCTSWIILFRYFYLSATSFGKLCSILTSDWQNIRLQFRQVSAYITFRLKDWLWLKNLLNFSAGLELQLWFRIMFGLLIVHSALTAVLVQWSGVSDSSRKN